MTKKTCPTCAGDGFLIIEEEVEDCSYCAGVGEIELHELKSDPLFEQMAKLARVHNKLILEIYSPFQF